MATRIPHQPRSGIRAAQIVAPLTKKIALIGRRAASRLNVTVREINRFVAFAASEWIATLPAGAEKDNAATTLVRTIAADSPAEAWQWALSIESPDMRKSAAFQTLTAMQKRDPATARQWLDAAPFSAEEKTQMRTMMENPSANPNLRAITPR